MRRRLNLLRGTLTTNRRVRNRSSTSSRILNRNRCIRRAHYNATSSILRKKRRPNLSRVVSVNTSNNVDEIRRIRSLLIILGRLRVVHPLRRLYGITLHDMMRNNRTNGRLQGSRRTRDMSRRRARRSNRHGKRRVSRAVRLFQSRPTRGTLSNITCEFRRMNSSNAMSR